MAKTLMQRMSVGLGLIVVLSAAAHDARADAVDFLFTGTGSGSLGGVAFTDRAFSVMISGDTDDIVDFGSPVTWIDYMIGTIEIEGLGVSTFSELIWVFRNDGTIGQSFLSVGFGSDIGGDLIDVETLGVGIETWDMTTSFGPIFTPTPNFNSTLNSGGHFSNVAMDTGLLTFTAMWDVTFTATVIPDSDSDGLSDDDEAIYGTDPDDPDTDDDGLLDGTEVMAGGCLDPLNPDSDGDTLSDGDEVLIHHTDPCSGDSDGDGFPDAIDPDPRVPDTSSGPLEDVTRSVAEFTDAVDLGTFDAPNANAAAGRRNALSTLFHNTANRIAAEDYDAAIAFLWIIFFNVEGNPQQHWMLPSDETTVIRDAAQALIEYLVIIFDN